MASNFPKLPGYVPTHDPTIVSFKKVSHIKLEQLRNTKNQGVPLASLPRPVEKNFLPEKTDASKSLSHTQYPNHMETEINELFEPTFAKLDKQVSIKLHLKLLTVSCVVFAAKFTGYILSLANYLAVIAVTLLISVSDKL